MAEKLNAAQRQIRAHTAAGGEGKKALVDVEPEDDDLSHPAVQEKILNPDPVTIELTNGTLTFHQPSLKMRKRIFGFATRVLSDAAAAPGSEKGLLAMRIASLLNYRDDLQHELLVLAAKLLGEPGKVTDERAESLATELEETTTADDIAGIYAKMCSIAGVEASASANPPARRRRKVRT